MGRPVGATQLMTRRAREEAQRTGLLPHEILLDMARGNPQKVQTVKEVGDQVVIEEEWVSLTVEEQRDAAKAAAPYYAPKLATVETVQGIADADIDRLIEQFAAEAGLASLAGREGAQGEAEAGGGAGEREQGRRRREL